MENNLVQHVIDSISKTDLSISKIDTEILHIPGMSGEGTRHFYNNLVNIQDARYLEIGTWKGSSVCAAMYKNKAIITCIDNWSEFGGPKEEFLINFNKFKGENTAIFIEDDCFKIDVSKFGKYNIFMYDGTHDSESHYKALGHFYNCLDETFIYVIDDWDWEFVRTPVNNSIHDLNLQILYKNEVFTEANPTGPKMHNGNCDARFWANGCGIFVLKKPHNC